MELIVLSKLSMNYLTLEPYYVFFVMIHELTSLFSKYQQNCVKNLYDILNFSYRYRKAYNKTENIMKFRNLEIH